MARVVIEGLSRQFGEVNAISDLDLAIEDGEFLSLLGPSGCGKTTTLRLLAGFLTPDAGRIIVGDRVLSSPGAAVAPEHRGMSMIFQSYAVWPHKTVHDNVAFGLKLRRRPQAEIGERVRRMLDLVRLEDLASRYPGELSGGQQQRVALARALVVEPTILLLDEPLSNLDASLREEMRFEIRRLHEEMAITSVYVTHDQSEAMVTSDRIAVMNQGQIEQIGTPEEIYERPRTQFVASFIGRTNCLPALVVDQQSVRCSGLTLAVSPKWHDAGIGLSSGRVNPAAGDLDHPSRRTGRPEARKFARRAHRPPRLFGRSARLPRRRAGDRSDLACRHQCATSVPAKRECAVDDRGRCLPGDPGEPLI